MQIRQHWDEKIKKEGLLKVNTIDVVQPMLSLGWDEEYLKRI